MALRIVKAEPAGGCWRVTYERGGFQVTKGIRLSECEKRVLRADQLTCATLMHVAKTGREADRDILVMQNESLPREELAALIRAVPQPQFTEADLAHFKEDHG